MRKLLIPLVVLAVIVAVLVRRRTRAVDRSGPPDTRFMLAMHNAFRRDLDRLDVAARAALSTPEGWTIFREELEFHHTAEDDDLWPELRGRLDRPDDIQLVDQMVAEHARLAPAIAAVADGFAGRGDLRAAVESLSGLLHEHLEHEERDALPLLERHYTEGDWRQYLYTERRKRGRKGAQFLCWVLDDASPEDEATVLAELPPPGRVFYRKVLKPRWDARRRWSAPGDPDIDLRESPQVTPATAGVHTP